MRFLVTGASGFIGKEFLGVLSAHHVTGAYFSRPRPGLIHIDLKDPESVRRSLDDLRPDAVIHCAARPSVDWCESHPEDAASINLAPVESLAKECARINSKLVFLSTDYVFDGSSGPYTEADATNPINVYGRLKLEAEGAIRRQSANHLIIRTTNVYGFDPESKNFLMAILPQLAAGGRVRVAIDQLGNPTTVHDLCSVTAELVADGHSGTFNVTGPDLVSRAEWLQRAAFAFGFDPTLVLGVPTSDLDQPAPRPKKSGLITLRVRSLVSTPLQNLDDGLQSMRTAWAAHLARLDESKNIQGALGV